LNVWLRKKEVVVMGVANSRSVILRIFLITTILVAGLVLATVFTSATGVFHFGVRMGQSNVFRSVTKGELALALFAALALAAVGVIALRRL
jgi:succinate dehydrogenase/fumarate reductase cytochrome b subunit